MKKIFGLSLVSILAALPMMASAADPANPVAGDPVGGGSTMASNAPKYELAKVDGTEGNIATAGYVKGAYNAAIKGVNKVADEVATAASSISTISSTLSSTYATQSGVAATINSATTSGSFSGAEVSGSFTSAAVTGSIASATTSASIQAMNEWGSSSATAMNVSASLTSGTVTGTADGTVSGTADGSTTGGVSVGSYRAS